MKGTTTLVSHDAEGKVGNWMTEAPTISADGRVVAFTAAPGGADTPNIDGSSHRGPAVFVIDLATSRLERISSDDDAMAGAVNSRGALSADGRWVVYSAMGAALPTHSDIFLHDRQSRTTTQLTHGSFRADSGNPAVSADGRRVAFQSTSGSHVVGDTNSVNDVFVMDVASRDVRRIYRWRTLASRATTRVLSPQSPPTGGRCSSRRWQPTWTQEPPARATSW